MQRLRAPEHGGQRLECGAHDVVLRLLGGQRGAARLRMKPQDRAPRILGLEAIGHHPGPHPPGGPELRHLLEEVHVTGEEERQPGRDVVDRESGVPGGLDVGDAVGQREGDLLRGRRARLTHVVPGDRDRVPPGDVLPA